MSHPYSRQQHSLVVSADVPKMRLRDIPHHWDVAITHWIAFDADHAARILRHDYRYCRRILRLHPVLARQAVLGQLARCGYTISPASNTVATDTLVVVG